jgi:membrane dipeptidase
MRIPAQLPIFLLVLPALLCAQIPIKHAAHTMTPKPNAAAVQRSAIVIDTHADTPQRFLDEHFDLSDPLGNGNFNLESARKGRLGAEFFSIWVEPTLYKGHWTKPLRGTR